MRLLKPSDFKIPARKYYVRIEEPVVLAMEGYREFIGTESVEHVVGPGPKFVFGKDTDFKEWLAQRREPGQPSWTVGRKSKAPVHSATVFVVAPRSRK
jgi:hypothetical protein